MREIIYYSRTAPTSGKFIKQNLNESGRLDIAVHAVIASFFLSHKIREDVILHLLFAGPPSSPKHLQLKPIIEGKTGIDKIYLSKSNVSGVLKRMLYKHKDKVKSEIFPGYWIESKGIIELVSDLEKQNRNIYILDSKGEDIRKTEIKENPVFIIGDHHGLPPKELKRIKKSAIPVSIGKKTYFASHTIAILSNELDRREEAGEL